MLTEKKFTNLMLRLLEVKRDEEKLNKAFKVFCPDFNHIHFGRYEALVVEALQEAVNDKGDWLDYFLYERNGEFTNKHIITDKDGKNLPLRNMKDLYNLITNPK